MFPTHVTTADDNQTTELVFGYKMMEFRIYHSSLVEEKTFVTVLHECCAFYNDPSTEDSIIKVASD